MLHSVYAFFMALLFMAYLAWDVQTMMGGRRYTISPEDYIMAAVQLFIDIVYIFLIMLGITSD
jgi:FtsH-binding integral membrane protein